MWLEHQEEVLPHRGQNVQQGAEDVPRRCARRADRRPDHQNPHAQANNAQAHKAAHNRRVAQVVPQSVLVHQMQNYGVPLQVVWQSQAPRRHNHGCLHRHRTGGHYADLDPDDVAHVNNTHVDVADIHDGYAHACHHANHHANQLYYHHNDNANHDHDHDHDDHDHDHDDHNNGDDRGCQQGRRVILPHLYQQTELPSGQCVLLGPDDLRVHQKRNSLHRQRPQVSEPGRPPWHLAVRHWRGGGRAMGPAVLCRAATVCCRPCVTLPAAVRRVMLHCSWQDDTNDGCRMYSDKKYCNVDGSFGDQWDADRAFQDYATNK